MRVTLTTHTLPRTRRTVSAQSVTSTYLDSPLARAFHFRDAISCRLKQHGTPDLSDRNIDAAFACGSMLPLTRYAKLLRDSGHLIR